MQYHLAAGTAKRLILITGHPERAVSNIIVLTVNMRALHSYCCVPMCAAALNYRAGRQVLVS